MLSHCWVLKNLFFSFFSISFPIAFLLFEKSFASPAFAELHFLPSHRRSVLIKISRISISFSTLTHSSIKASSNSSSSSPSFESSIFLTQAHTSSLFNQPSPTQAIAAGFVLGQRLCLCLCWVFVEFVLGSCLCDEFVLIQGCWVCAEFHIGSGGGA